MREYGRCPSLGRPSAARVSHKQLGPTDGPSRYYPHPPPGRVCVLCGATAGCAVSCISCVVYAIVHVALYMLV